MNIHELFEDKAEVYAQARPRYPSELHQWLAGVCSGNSAAWDAGCGNGQAAVDLSEYFQAVEATDISPAQIANAIQSDCVTYSVQPSEATNFLADSFDLVCVAQALHWFDYEHFWPEVKRVLNPEGVFAAWGYSWPHINSAIDELLEVSFFSVIRPYWASQNKLLWDEYADVPFPFERLEASEIELTVEWSVEQFFAYLHSWSATRRCIEATGDEFFESSFGKVSEIWGAEVLRKISMDFVVIAGKNSA